MGQRFVVILPVIFVKKNTLRPKGGVQEVGLLWQTVPDPCRYHIGIIQHELGMRLRGPCNCRETLSEQHQAVQPARKRSHFRLRIV